MAVFLLAVVLLVAMAGVWAGKMYRDSRGKRETAQGSSSSSSGCEGGFAGQRRPVVGAL
jgi:hypothetical protein